MVADKSNIVIPPADLRLDGFIHDVSEYRVPSVRRTRPGGRMVATVPAAGNWYPGVILYDGPGNERAGIFIDGVERGIAVADADDNRQRLFFLNAPRTFRGGETIEVRALTATGAYRTENIVLLKERPASRSHVYAFNEVLAAPAGGGVTLTWTTTWPAACTVEWRGASQGRSVEELAVNNHRVALGNLPPHAACEFRLTARTRDGRTVESGWRAFRTDPPEPPAGRVRLARVPLRVAGAPRAVFPVTSGVPFPKGALGPENHVRLLDAAGREVPLQTEALARWEDGSVKWLLVDAQAGPLVRSPLALEYGAEVIRAAVPDPLRIAENAEAVTVTTGPLSFTIGKKRFGFVQSLAVDGVPVLSPERPGAFYLTGPDGAVYTTLAPPEEVAVEQAGPLRAVVRVSGHHASADGRKLFAYTVRFHAYAGQRYLRVQHTFGNDAPSDFTSIRGLTLRVPVAPGGGRPRWSVGESAGVLGDRETVELQQHTDDRYTLTAGGKIKVQGRRTEGYAAWSDGTRTVTLAMRDFWQNYPKNLAVTAEGLEVALCPALRPDEYDEANGTIDEHRIYYYLHGGVYKLHEGVTKTHDLWLDFAHGAPPASIVRFQREPLAATAPAEWYAGSMVLGEVAVPRPTGILAAYDRAFARSFAAFLKNRETNREYGMLNFGDWWGERIINWGNSEYDTQHAFLLQYLRTGNLDYFRAGEQVEWHNRDVDMVHYHHDPQVAGGVWAHCIGHTGDYYTERPRAGAPPGGFREGSPRGHMAADHTFVEGHFDYYFLTGDRRSLETARRIVDRYDSYYTRNYDFNNCRQPGWHLIMSMAAYKATHDRYYLNAAKIIVERVLERQTPDGGWKRELVPGHCFCTPRHQGNAGFMVGVLLTGLKDYQAATGDERVADAIVKGAHFLVNAMWVPEVKGFHYTSCPNSNVGPSYNFRLFDALVFAHRRTGDAQLRDVLAAGTGPAVESMNGSGKGFTQQTRVTPHFINHLVLLQEQARAK